MYTLFVYVCFCHKGIEESFITKALSQLATSLRMLKDRQMHCFLDSSTLLSNVRNSLQHSILMYAEDT